MTSFLFSLFFNSVLMFYIQISFQKYNRGKNLLSNVLERLPLVYGINKDAIVHIFA